MLSSQWTENELDQVEKCPKEQANISFGDVELTEICQVLTPTQTQNQPTITWNSECDKYYAIFMMDPDAPSRSDPKYREWYHWGVLNIPGSDINKGETIAEYIGAGPPPNTGLHRYVFLIYLQQGKVKPPNERLVMGTKGRYSHKAKDFAAEYDLGSPISGACFQAEWDDYVAKLYAQFK